MINDLGYHQDTLLLTPYGSSIPIGDVKIGDILASPDRETGFPVKSIQRSIGKSVVIIPKKGDLFTAGREQAIATVSSKRKSRGVSREVGKLSKRRVSDILVSGKSWNHLNKLYRTPLNFINDAKSDMDPYMLGLIIGDGSIKKASVEIWNQDQEIKDYVRLFCEKNGNHYSVTDYKNNLSQIRIKMKEGETRNSTGKLIRDCMNNRYICEEKHIPDVFKFGSAEDRLRILAGLIDTDGSHHDSGFDFISKSRQLTDDVSFVAKSLGMASYVQECTKTCQTGASGQYWRTFIHGATDKIPCLIPRKKSKPREQIKNVLNTSFTIQEKPESELVYITCDGTENIVSSDFVVLSTY